MGRHKKRERTHSPYTSTRHCQSTSTSRQHRPHHHKHSDFGKDMTTVVWERHKSQLNTLFFNDSSFIKKGTREYDDFWIFLQKMVSVEKLKKEGKSDNDQSTSSSSDKYNKIHRLCFTFTKAAKDYNILPVDFELEQEQLTVAHLEQFMEVLQMYADFLQKQIFMKLCKLRKSQADLPIHEYKDVILKSVRENQVTIIAGDTGCGKSTQVPQYLIRDGWQSIACTQPRRIACISLCKRVAFETLNEYATEIGYQIRFEKSKTKHTRILFLTEGLLLRQVATDPLLSMYNIVILDEVHERHLHSDFLLGIMKCIIIQKPDVKLILMSATINIQLYSQYFGNVPVIQVPGRLYPIQLQYFPISKEERKSRSSRLNPGPFIRILQMIEQKHSNDERGDVLIFLSGIAEISSLVEAAQMYAQQTKRWIILPLHSTLSLAEQDKIFDYAPEGIRKCIVSTNIAETSVTIDGIRFVVDAGKVKEMSYDPQRRMQRLQEFWISKASAEQRKGRAGRTGPGACFRMYDESEYEAFDDYSVPEIQRVPLDSLVLQMISMGLPDARKFPFIEPPSLESLENALVSLIEHGALYNNEKITPIGNLLTRLPVDIAIGKMLIMGTLFDKIELVLLLAAGLSVQAPFTNQVQRDPSIQNARRELESDNGDPFTLLNAYNKWMKVKSEDQTATRKWCRRHGLEEQRFYEMTKLYNQFKQLLQDADVISLLSQKRLLSSTERAQRHGEIKHLHKLRREQFHAQKKRKVLKLESDAAEGIHNDKDDDDGMDLKSIEFQLKHDRHEIQGLLRGIRNIRSEDIILLKILLCSGLYPSLALVDEFNSFKPGTDQLFHTKGKPFVIVHPLSGFSLQPEILQISQANIMDCPGFPRKFPVSNKHQLLLYTTLLETTKPYIVNNTRIPAVQALLLFANSIDTNENFSRLVFDSWLEVQFPCPDDSQDLILQVLNLRDQWMKLVEEKLTGLTNGSSEKLTEGFTLAKQLISFFHTDVYYSIKRLLTTDVQELYIGYKKSEALEISKVILGHNAVPHLKKGGYQLKDYLVYNCLCDSSQSCQDYLQTRWICPLCEEEMFITALQKMEHELTCNHNQAQKNEGSQEIKEDRDPNKQTFFCDQCQKKLYLSPIDILRHKKLHR